MNLTAAANHDRRAGTCTRCGKNFADCYSASSCDKNLKVAAAAIVAEAEQQEEDENRLRAQRDSTKSAEWNASAVWNARLSSECGHLVNFWKAFRFVAFYGQTAPKGWYRIKVKADYYTAALEVLSRSEVKSYRIRDGYASGARVITFRLW